jgi:hypothetical protein
MNMERAFKGIWIPAEIWLSKELKIMEKLFLVEIDSLDNEDGCFASNEYFSNFFDLSKNRCSEIIKSLEKKGFIEIEYIYKKNKKSIEKRIIKIIRNIEGGIRNIDQGYSENRRGYSENCEDNNTNNNISINNTNNKKEKKKKRTDLDVLINEYTSNSFLQETIIDFMKMRKSIKKPVTERALKGILNKLDKLATTDDIKIKILENSIENCWQGVFPLKDNFGNYNSNKYQDNNNSNSVEDLQKHQGYIDPEKMKPVSQDDLDEIDELQRELDEMGGGKIEEWL